MILSPKQQVIAAVNQWVDECSLPPDGQLPSENYIADTVNVARGTVRSGLEQLIQEGVLVKRGRKLFVVKNSAASPSPLLRRTIVMIGVPDPDEALRVRNTGYLAAVQAGAISAAAQAGMPSLYLDFSRLTVADVKDICRNRPAGVLFFHSSLIPGDFPRMLEIFRSNGIPMVSSEDNAHFASIDRVESDQFGGAKLLTEELIRRGRKRILIFLRSDRPEPWVAKRIGGYRAAMKEAGLVLPKEPEVAPFIEEYGIWTREAYHRQVRFFAGCLLEYFDGSGEEPDTILARTDWDVPVIAGALRLLKREPGKDVWLAGYDNKYSSCRWNEFEPATPVLTVGKRNSVRGRKMVERLLERIADPRPAEPVCRLEESILIDPANQTNKEGAE